MLNEAAIAARLPLGDVEANIGRLRGHRCKPLAAFRRVLAEDIGVSRESLPNDWASLYAIADWHKDKLRAIHADEESHDHGERGGHVRVNCHHDYLWATENGVCARCSSTKIHIAEFGMSVKCDNCRVEFCG